MKFYLGVHRPQWLPLAGVPLMVSRRWLAIRRTMPVAAAPWVLDSGGFTELSSHGRWTVSVPEFIEQVRRIVRGVGEPDWCAPMDWMCEPAIRAKTGFTVEQHQLRTVKNFLALRRRAPELRWVPVLQGWELSDYGRAVAMYGEAGVELSIEPLVGLGSVCRRQATAEIAEIVLSLAPLRLHGFGVKSDGLKQYGHLLASSDSMAWSYGGRRDGYKGHTPHGARCGNHLHYALEWRARLLRRIEHSQPSLWGS